MCWEIVFFYVILVAALVSFILEKIPTDLTTMLLFAVVLLVSMVTHSAKLPTVNEVIGVSF